jgi:Leucine-rich repeat (LRR) protein
MSLTELELSGFRDPLPDWFGTCLPKLTSLNFQYNQFQGPIPESVCQMNQLTSIRIALSSLTGTIPSCIGNLTQLTTLDFQFNSLSSTIPDSIGELIQLRAVDLSGNKLSGILPASLANLSQIVSFFAVSNMLSGPIELFAQLPKLTALELSSNRFSGTIPGNFSVLQNFLLQNNQLTGSIPEYLFSAASLTSIFKISNNRISGTLPSSRPMSLSVFSADNNRLEGTLPNWFCDLNFYSNIFNFAQNNLRGTLPVCLGAVEVPNLISLNFSTNQFSGTIPISIGFLNNRSFTFLDLSHNQLHGTIPASMAYLTSLSFLDLSYNKFDGPLPVVVINIQSLTRLDVAGNLFSGSLDVLFSKTRYVPAYLNVSHNQLSGIVSTLASDLCNSNHTPACPSAAILDARGNQFDCPIPEYNQLDIMFLRDPCLPPYITFSIYSASLFGVFLIVFGIRHFMLLEFGNVSVAAPAYAPSAWKWRLFVIMYVASLVTLVSDAYTMWVIGQYLISRIDNCQSVNSFSVWRSLPALASQDTETMLLDKGFSFPKTIYSIVLNWNTANGGKETGFWNPFDRAFGDDLALDVSQLSSICSSIESGCSMRHSTQYPTSFATECFMEFDDKAPFGGTSHRTFFFSFIAIVSVRAIVELSRLLIVFLSWIYRRIIHVSWSIDFVGISLGSPLLVFALQDDWSEFFKVIISHQPTHHELIWRIVYQSLLCSIPLLGANLYFLFAVSQSGLKVLNMFSVLSAFVTIPLNVFRAVQTWRSLDQSFSTKDLNLMMEMSQNVSDLDSMKLDAIATAPVPPAPIIVE